MTGRRPDDAGTILLLTVGLSVVLLLLVAVVVDVSKVILARRAVASAADGAALAAAQQSHEAVIRARQGALDVAVPLDPAEVASVVATYEAEAGEQQPGLRLSGRVDAADPGLAVVEARRTITLPFVGWLGIARVEVEAEARARAPVRP
jgi:Flp pilus assembly protein TadG